MPKTWVPSLVKRPALKQSEKRIPEVDVSIKRDGSLCKPKNPATKGTAFFTKKPVPIVTDSIKEHNRFAHRGKFTGRLCGTLTDPV